MGRKQACPECATPTTAGVPVLDRVVCQDCWDVLLRTATSRLADRVTELIGTDDRIHPMVVSRVVAASLPSAADRLRVLIELRSRGLGPQRSFGKRSTELFELVEGLRAAGLPGRILGQRRLHPSESKVGCAQCGQERKIAGRLNGEALCALCWRIHPDVLKPCVRCGKTDYLSRDSLCRGCRRRAEVNALFTAERITARPEFAGIRDALLVADGAYLHRFMTSKKSSWNALRRLVAGGRVITHETLDELDRPGASLLRSFLVASGVLPERNERLTAFEMWIKRTADTITDDTDKRSYVGFARWRHLRRARQHITLTPAQVAGQRRQLTYVRNLLSELHSQGLTIRTARQTTLDLWLAAGPAERLCVKGFLQWCRTNGTNQNLIINSTRHRPLPAVFLLPEHQHHALLFRILDPEQPIGPALRLAASLVLLYGIRNHEIAALSLTDIIITGRHVWIRFGPEPLQLPGRLADYARQAVSERTITRFGRKTEDHQWLFPGLFHDQPIDPATLASRLAAIGVKPERTRSTAMGQLAQQLPPPILARLTGLAPTTTVRWNAAVAASYAANAPATGRFSRKGREDLEE